MRLVELRGVTKRFGPVLALEDVTLALRPGEVHALIGENGAGKSTLMKVLSGVYRDGEFEGEIRVDEKQRRFRSPKEAESAGIAIIHQELATFAHLSVAENLFVGHWPKGAAPGLVDWNDLREKAASRLRDIGAECSPDDPMGELSVGQQQLVEIAKALSRDTQTLILDEPTSALTPREIENLFKVLRKLREAQKSIVYISHKLDEVFALSDTISVLRDGKCVHSSPASELDEAKLIAMMVGRPLDRLFPLKPKQNPSRSPLLKVGGFNGFDRRGRKLFGPVSFELGQGEILGFSGLLGAGRTELMKGLCGDRAIRTEGEALLSSRPFRARGPGGALRNRVVYISEDRKRESILPQRSLDENTAISRLVTGGLSRVIRTTAESRRSEASLKQLRTRCTGPTQEIRQLSGGNQQKVILARALQMDPQVVILDEPTRGIDVGARYEIYEILFELASSGKGVIVVSSDLQELMGLCDRIVVLSQGDQKGCLNREQFSQESIMKLAVPSAAH